MQRSIRVRMLTVICGVVFLLAAAAIYPRFFAGRIRQYEVSPDGRYIAEWRVYEHGGATSTNLSTVQVKTRVSPFRRTVLTGLDYGAKLSLMWVDSKDLLVQCGNCGDFEIRCDTCGDGLYIFRKETSWHGVKIRYSSQALKGAAGTRGD